MIESRDTASEAARPSARVTRQQDSAVPIAIGAVLSALGGAWNATLNRPTL